MRAWIRFVGWDAPARAAVRASLEKAGVELDEAPSDRLPAILAVGAASGGVEEAVRAALASGSDHVLVVTAGAGAPAPDLPWRLIAAGASDVLTWAEAAEPARQVAARLERWRTVEALVASAPVRDRLVGDSVVWHQVLRRIVEVARFTDASFLITGESGTGKELAAGLVHELDPRPDKRDFVVVDCTTVVPALSGSEFFGHEKGAFTGAIAARDGAFALADQGTLFLDEVGELPLPMQAELLRVVQEGTYKRVGSNVWRRTRFRLVCATNRDLLAEEAAGRFRRDLYYRIAGWVVRLPRLDERREDIPALTRSFLGRPGDGEVEIDRSVWDLLLRRDYPGNVRDLRHLVWRMSRRHVGPGPITAGDVPAEDRPSPDPDGEARCDAPGGDGFEEAVRRALARGLTLREITQAATETAIRVACADEAWNLRRAARRLGVTDRALQLRRAASRLAGAAPEAARP
jgi:transcriptional regulator with GAF, ATPase, and Fis domain